MTEARALFRQCAIAAEHIDRWVAPCMIPTVLDRTIEGLFHRVRSWLGSATRLDNTEDNQALLVGARSTLESCVDLCLLTRGSPGDQADALATLVAWESAMKLKNARRIVAHAVSQGEPPHPTLVAAIRSGSTIEAESARRWTNARGKVVVPMRWTGTSLEHDCGAADISLQTRPDLEQWRRMPFAHQYAQLAGYMNLQTHGAGLAMVRGAASDTRPAECGLGYGVILEAAIFAAGVVLDRHARLQTDLLAELATVRLVVVAATKGVAFVSQL